MDPGARTIVAAFAKVLAVVIAALISAWSFGAATGISTDAPDAEPQPSASGPVPVTTGTFPTVAVPVGSGAYVPLPAGTVLIAAAVDRT